MGGFVSRGKKYIRDRCYQEQKGWEKLFSTSIKIPYFLLALDYQRCRSRHHIKEHEEETVLVK